MNIILIGLSHKTAPIEVRERHSFSPVMLRSILTHFDTMHSQAHLKEVKEGVILSTCNRLEIYALVGDPHIARQSIIEFLDYSCGVGAETFSQYLYTLHNEEAVDHLLRVASGLDSMVLGEPQILGQIRDAFEAALSQRAARTVLSALFRAAIHTGKRARTETSISVNPSSISSVAAGLANNLLGDLSQRQVLLIGAGEMGEIAVKALIKRGVSKITVANRTFEAGQKLAQDWGGRAITFQQLPEAMVKADIIITSTGAPHTILNKELLEPAMAARPDRPLFLIDIAVPRDIDVDVTEISNVYLHDIDDLQGQAEDNVRERESEIPRVEAIIEKEAGEFLEWFCSLEAVATITALRQQLEELRQHELEHLFKRLELDECGQKLVDKMTHRLVNKILHKPTMHLKQESANGNGARYLTTVRHLFSLDKAAKKK